MTTMNNLQDLGVMIQLAREREMSLRHATVQSDTGGNVRRWLGRQLVRTGTWLANERPMRHAAAG